MRKVFDRTNSPIVKEEYARLFMHHVVVDGNLITGQNPASSTTAAQEVLNALQ